MNPPGCTKGMCARRHVKLDSPEAVNKFRSIEVPKGLCQHHLRIPDHRVHLPPDIVENVVVPIVEPLGSVEYWPALKRGWIVLIRVEVSETGAAVHTRVS